MARPREDPGLRGQEVVFRPSTMHCSAGASRSSSACPVQLLLIVEAHDWPQPRGGGNEWRGDRDSKCPQLSRNFVVKCRAME